MLPDVQAHHRLTGLGHHVHDRVVLVLGGHDLELVALRDQPYEARTEQAGGRVRELFLEGIEGAEAGVDGRTQAAGRLAAAGRRHAVPEKDVVEVTATLVANAGAVLAGLGQNRFQILIFELGAFDGFLEFGQISVVMLLVVNLHRTTVDIRFERVVVIR